MCGDCFGTITRRSFVGGTLAGAAGLALAGSNQATSAAAASLTTGRLTSAPLTGAPLAAAPLTAAALTVAPGLDILPRSAWGADLPPKGPMPPEDVRFLLVHHTASSNIIPSQRNLIRSAYAFHTSSAKRWNDVAYNFFVGPDGTVWEGRSGSLDGPVRADATGGNQGFAQLVCLLGDFSSSAPPPAMQASLIRLLAHLSVRYDLSTWKDASTSFVSQGSDKWAAGQTVTARTISGHRDMTYTTCPGNAAYGLLDDWRHHVHPIAAAARQQPGLQPAVRLRLQAP